MSADEPANRTDVVGLVPAAGRASRLGPLPCSKELLRLPPERLGLSPGTRPAAVSEQLLRGMAAAGIERVFLALSPGKWDIPAYYGSGDRMGLRIAYLVCPDSRSIVETLDRAFPFVKRCQVAVGFPDVLLTPADALRRLVDRHRAGTGEVTLGLFPTSHPERADMVATDETGRVLRIAVKEPDSGLRYTWMLAVWGPDFSCHLHRFARRQDDESRQELYPGHALQAALDEGMEIDSVVFPHGSSLDIGTPEALVRALADGGSAGSPQTLQGAEDA